MQVEVQIQHNGCAEVKSLAKDATDRKKGFTLDMSSSYILNAE